MLYSVSESDVAHVIRKRLYTQRRLREPLFRKVSYSILLFTLFLGFSPGLLMRPLLPGN